MEETFEELVTKHTRRELEEMALKMGVQTLGGTKSQLAEAIMDARKGEKSAARAESQKPAVQEKSKEVPPMIEKPKATPKERFPVPVGTKGVMAKIGAAEKLSANLQKAGREMREEAIREMTRGVAEFHKGVSSQVKENEDAAAKIDSGARALQAESDALSGEMRVKAKDLNQRSRKMLEDGIQRFNAGQADFKKGLLAQVKDNEKALAGFNSGAKDIRTSMGKMSAEFHKAGEEIRREGTSNLHKGLKDMRIGIDSQVRDNREAVARIGSGAREIQGRARAFQGEIQRFQEQDLKNYSRDFYYG